MSPSQNIGYFLGNRNCELWAFHMLFLACLQLHAVQTTGDNFLRKLCLPYESQAWFGSHRLAAYISVRTFNMVQCRMEMSRASLSQNSVSIGSNVATKQNPL